jgi:hypothetical protein
VAAEHYHYRALVFRSRRDGVDYRAKVAGDEDVRKRLEESGEAAVLAWRRRKLSGGDLVGPPLDRDSANSG